MILITLRSILRITVFVSNYSEVTILWLCNNYYISGKKDRLLVLKVIVVVLSLQSLPSTCIITKIPARAIELTSMHVCAQGNEILRASAHMIHVLYSSYKNQPEPFSENTIH